MQIVIDIPEEAYDFIKRTGYHTQSLYEAIKNGTPLPQGHGRLIDADAVYDDFEKGEYDLEDAIEYAQTIIEPYKVESER